MGPIGTYNMDFPGRYWAFSFHKRHIVMLEVDLSQPCQIRHHESCILTSTSTKYTLFFLPAIYRSFLEPTSVKPTPAIAKRYASISLQMFYWNGKISPDWLVVQTVYYLFDKQLNSRSEAHIGDFVWGPLVFSAWMCFSFLHELTLLAPGPYYQAFFPLRKAHGDQTYQVCWVSCQAR